MQLSHITPFEKGDGLNTQNLIVVCPTCNVNIDRVPIPSHVLQSVKEGWVKHKTLGKKQIVGYLEPKPEDNDKSKDSSPHIVEEAENYRLALQKSNEFDKSVEEMVKEIRQIRNESVFINKVLKPLFEKMKCEGIQILHHRGRMEYGKDMVFYERDKFGGFINYAVVACIGKIHANASNSGSSGYYQKIKSQIIKCFAEGYDDPNRKVKIKIDAVIVSCSGEISEEAMRYLRNWEEENRRRLIFLQADDIAGLKITLFQ